ncbi:MAG TPA: flavin reductase family protein [Armatimonadota bacterium]|jgi:flavin reductase (DIM6/NTAB) family NADH-FMN oxidoreductase RutF
MEKQDYADINRAWNVAFGALLKPGFLLSVVDAAGKPNAMTIAWGFFGHAWGRTVVTIMVRPSRYSYHMLREVPEFTLNVPGPGLEAAVEFCGTKSGRDLDKLAACSLTPVPGRLVRSPALAECIMHFECRCVHENYLVPQDLDPDLIKPWYPQGDYHRFFFGEIVAAYGVPHPEALLGRL